MTPVWWRNVMRLRGWFVIPFATAVFYAPILLGVRTFPPGDFTDHFFPFSLYQQQVWLREDSLLWNPYTYSGHPFLADVQAAVFYPVSTLLLLVTLPSRDPAARFYILQLEAILHIVLGGVGMALLARDLTGSRWAGWTAGICFAFSGYLTGYPPQQLAVLRTAVWLPLLFWSLGRGWQTPQQTRWWIGAGLVGASAMLAGHSQTLLLAGYAVTAWLTLLVVYARSSRWQPIVGTLGAGLLAAGLSAIQWLPSLEFVQHSVRASLAYEAVSGGFGWSDLWQLVLPGVLTQFSPLYIGVMGMGLALSALVAVAHRQRRGDAPPLPASCLPWRVAVLYFAGLGVVALWISLGDRGGLYPWLYRFAPGWAWFRGQERSAYLVTIALCGLAAYGAALLPQMPQPIRRRSAITAGVLVVGWVYGFGALRQLVGQSAVDHGSYLVVALVTLVMGMILAVAVWLPGWSPRRSVLLAVLAFLNLLWANAGANLASGTPAERVVVAPEIHAVGVAATEHPTAAQGLQGRVYNEFRVYENYGMRVGVEDVWGSSPLRVRTYAELFESFPLDRMWRLLGVSHVLTWRRELFGPSELLAQFPQATDTTYLHRLPAVPQRAWLATRVENLDDDSVIARLADHGVDLNMTAYVAPDSGLVGGEVLPGEASIQLARNGVEQLQVEVNSEHGGLLVVSEVWMPGWTVRAPRCAGQPCPAADADGRAYLTPDRANLALIGIWLPPGVVRFELVYAPASVQWGGWISLGTAFLLAVVVAGSWLRTRRRAWA